MKNGEMPAISGRVMCRSSRNLPPNARLRCKPKLEFTQRSAQRLPYPLAADEHECHQRWLRERITPAVAGSILNDTVSLTHVNGLAVIELEDDLAPDHNAIVIFRAHRLVILHHRSSST